MAGQMQADKDDLDAFAKSVRDKHGALVGLIQQVHAAEEHTTSTWDGAAKQAFDSLMTQYYTNAEKLNNALADTADKLVKTASNFDNQDAQYAQQVAKQEAEFSLNLPSQA